MISKLKHWLMELRAPFLTASVVPVILGTVIAWTRNDVFNPLYFLLALAGGVLAHMGTNVANDYYDHKSGNDEVNKEFVRPFSGGSRVIQMGLLKPKEVLSGAVAFFALATLIGVYLAWVVGPFVLVLVAVGLFSGFFYTGYPFNLASRGIGELFVGVNFGLLMTLGAYYIQTRVLALEPLVASIPIALLITAVLYINEFPDFVADKTVGKNTLVVRLNRDKAAVGYAFLMFGTYAAIFLAAALRITPIYTLIAFVTLPLTVKSVQNANLFHSSSFQLAPSNAFTIVCHLFTGVMLSLGYVLSGLAFLSVSYYAVLSLIGLCTALTVFFYWKIATPRNPRRLSRR